MPEQIKKILEKVLDWWKKFNNKQRALILSAIGVVVIALVILCAVVTMPHPETLYICKDYSEAASIKEILEGDSVEYSTDSDGLVFYVDEADMAQASILLGQNEFPSQAYDINNAVSGSLTTTESDKQKLWQDYLEKKFQDHISQLSAVEACEENSPCHLCKRRPRKEKVHTPARRGYGHHLHYRCPPTHPRGVCPNSEIQGEVTENLLRAEHGLKKLSRYGL